LKKLTPLWNRCNLWTWPYSSWTNNPRGCFM